jgi:hypothetical protein
MANQSNSKFFSVMVIGNNHKEIMDKYSMNLKVEPYVKYEYLKADKYLSNSIKALDNILANFDKIGLDPHMKESLSLRIKTLKQMTPFEYYRELTDGMYYDENGNALSTENLDGKWKTARIGRNFSLPLRLKDGSESYSARMADIDWFAMNEPTALYEAAWEMVVDGREPTNAEEERVYESMKDKTTYFSNFKSKEDYVNYSTRYWNYAVVTENGWVDVDSKGGDEKEWINNFFDNFIKNIPDEELITIYECSVNNG